MKKSAHRKRFYILGLFLFSALLVFLLFFGTQHIRNRYAPKQQSEIDFDASISAENLASILMESNGMQNMTRLTPEQIVNYYAVPKPLLETACVQTGNVGTVFSEIAVFPVGNEKDTSIFMKAAADRIQAYTAVYNSVNSESNRQSNYYLGMVNGYLVLVLGAPYEQTSSALAAYTTD